MKPAIKARHMPQVSAGSLLVLSLCAASCQSPSAMANQADRMKTQSTYDKATGRLQELKVDTDGNGTLDAVAHMDGATLKEIELDRDGDGQADRWEYYGPGTPQANGANKFDRWAIITRAEEGPRPDAPRTRREFYERGQLQRAEEDTDLDGRMDKWEVYENGELRRLDLDLSGKGVPDQRLIYGANGDVVRVEQDRDGDGRFEAVPEGQRP
jgi:hypothetical protein